ncbi:jg2593 [Pararge aegeria aegeria]|uniref:Jg2593 protein n=1 Tax=Pararge aegeria aegeria TaxID=348720 RepID=A0A8S4SBN8_9NEOP|nr:jg2593 [Pararge aegeria aegeria]
MAGHFQNQRPNACRHASSGAFGSKFVTVCVTGDSNNQIHLEGYQVSGQCQALVRDGILLPTRDAPELGYIRDCSPQQYVPDVYYKVGRAASHTEHFYRLNVAQQGLLINMCTLLLREVMLALEYIDLYFARLRVDASTSR